MAQKTGQNAIKYSIITAFSKKGLDAAEKGLKKLRDSFKKTSLGSKLTFAAIGAGLTALAAKSLAAAKEQDKLQRKLEFSLKTLGETTAIPSVNRFLDTLERQTGVASSTLIPAFMSLSRVTKQMTDAYDALNLALDISAITGDDVAVIADAMAKGFTGNATALGKLIPGLGKATIKAANMQKIMARLNAEFGGAATGTMDTYASKLAKLRVSINKSMEILGTGIINLLQNLTKTTNIEDLGKALEKFAKKVAYILEGLPVFFRTLFTKMGEELKKSFFGRLLLKYIEAQANALEAAADAAAKYGYYANERRMGGFGPRLWEIKNTKKWAGVVVDTAKKIKKESPLSKYFDLERAALAAARLNGRLSKEEEERVKALEALKTEGLSDDEEHYRRLMQISAAAARSQMDDQNAVAANLKTQLAAMLTEYQAMYDAMANRARYVTSEIGGRAVTAPRDFGMPAMPSVPATVVPQIPTPVVPEPGYGSQVPTAMPSQPAQPSINVTVNAGAIGSEEYLVGVIGDALTKYTRLGNTTAPAGFF